MTNVLISGASIAGLTTAWRLGRLGYEVTLVEVASAPRVGGTAVDLRPESLDVARRMGILEELEASKLGLESIEFKDADDVTRGSMPAGGGGLEIERSKLVQILYAGLPPTVELLFGDGITALHDRPDRVDVTLRSGARRAFDLVIGADGAHSIVRALQFGDVARHVHFLGAYFAIAIVKKSLIRPNTLQMFNVPGKVVMLNAYKDKTDIVFSFLSEELPYDFRDVAHQRSIIAERITGHGWRTAELHDEFRQADNFYFDKFCQVRIPSWTRGRVALVGDAAYCASPAAGMGGALAMEGAAALVDALATHEGDLAAAFHAYDAGLRPRIDEVQAMAVAMLEANLIPRTEEAIRARNAQRSW